MCYVLSVICYMFSLIFIFLSFSLTAQKNKKKFFVFLTLKKLLTLVMFFREKVSLKN